MKTLDTISTSGLLRTTVSIEHLNIAFGFFIWLKSVWDPTCDMYLAHVNSMMLINIWYPVRASWKTFHKFWWEMPHKYSYTFFFKLSFPTVLDHKSRQTRGGWLDYIMRVVWHLLILYVTNGAWENKTHKASALWNTEWRCFALISVLHLCLQSVGSRGERSISAW